MVSSRPTDSVFPDLPASLRAERRGGIAVLWLNRSEKRGSKVARS